MRFFNAYDASRDLNILMLKKRLEQKKQDHKRVRTNQAFDYAEKIGGAVFILFSQEGGTSMRHVIRLRLERLCINYYIKLTNIHLNPSEC